MSTTIKGTVAGVQSIKGKLKEIPPLDKTLSKEGCAADAMAVGNAINGLTAEDVGARPNTWMPTASDVGARPNTWTPTAEQVGARPSTWLPTIADIGAAPAGYIEQTINPATEDDLNNMLSAVLATMPDNSIKYILVAPTTANVLDGGAFGCRLYRRLAGYACASFFSYGSATTVMVEKTLSGSTWNPLSWVNPPMLPGVQYRTTERWNGKAVYTQLVDYEAVTNGTRLSAPYSIIRCSAKLDGWYILPYSNASGSFSNSYSAWLDVNNGSCVFHCGSAQSGKKLTVQFWYAS